MKILKGEVIEYNENIEQEENNNNNNQNQNEGEVIGDYEDIDINV